MLSSGTGPIGQGTGGKRGDNLNFVCITLQRGCGFDPDLEVCVCQVLPHAFWCCQGVARWHQGYLKCCQGVAWWLQGLEYDNFLCLRKSMFAPLVPRGGWVWGTLPLILGHKWPLGVKRGVWGILPSFQGQNQPPQHKEGVQGIPPILGCTWPSQWQEVV